jgi:nucleoid DNA-binding protein
MYPTWLRSTDAEIQNPAAKTVEFNAGKALKDAVKGG